MHGNPPEEITTSINGKNTSYREIIEQVRQQEAIKLLQQPQLSLTMIALKLGYSELAVLVEILKLGLNKHPVNGEIKTYSQWGRLRFKAAIWLSFWR